MTEDEIPTPSTPPKSGKLTSILYGLAAVAVIAFGLLRVGGSVSGFFDESDAANKLVNDANDYKDDGDKFNQEGLPYLDLVFKPEHIEGVPGSRDAFRSDAEKGLAAFEKVEAQFRKAGDLFAEAATKRTNEHFQAYLRAKSAEFIALADIRKNIVEQFRLMLDSNMNDGAVLNEKLTTLDAEITELRKKREAFGAEADKVMAEHPDVFKQ